MLHCQTHSLDTSTDSSVCVGGLSIWPLLNSRLVTVHAMQGTHGPGIPAISTHDLSPHHHRSWLLSLKGIQFTTFYYACIKRNSQICKLFGKMPTLYQVLKQIRCKVGVLKSLLSPTEI